MARDPRYDILFEPVQIGPVTAKNRFYQVPHSAGMGHRHPNAQAGMRQIKAEGGWAVVCTEESGIHPSGDITPSLDVRLWDDSEIPYLARIADSVHMHDALAGIELNHGGPSAQNLYSREVPIGPSMQMVAADLPMQVRAMDKQDIVDLRRWHRNAALRCKKAGFDIIYVYAAKLLSLQSFFLSRRHNQRTDEYGGSLRNRCRLLMEMLEDTKEAVGESCGIVCRVSVDELMGPTGLHKEEAMEMIALLDHLPDMWDLTLSGWDNDSQTSRFSEEAFQEPFVTTIKQLSKKPILGVGRFTSPDTMVRQIRQGTLDMIGAARPSIADPFLPKKIEEGRVDDIRECIGCNICVSSEYLAGPIVCTQNPTMGEEWRRGWHPERIRPKESNATVLIVGGGPAGLECAMALGKRGYEVTLAEATTELGGRVTRESRLPGLAAWGRVRDYRVQQIDKLPNVQLFMDSALTEKHIMSFGFEHIVFATGAKWRHDGVGRFHLQPIPIADQAEVVSPDDIMDGRKMSGHVVIYDDDHYYLGGVLAEHLVKGGCRVTLVTPAGEASSWTHNTMEQHRIQTRLIEIGVDILPHRAVCRVREKTVETACIYTNRVTEIACDSVVMVTSRKSVCDVHRAVLARAGQWEAAGIATVEAIGDALAPGTIAHATFAGRKYAEQLDAADIGDTVAFKREMIAL